MMTTFQAVIFGFIHGMCQFLPIGLNTHYDTLSYVLSWQAPPELLQGMLTLSSLLALLVYFRHDWASMISCFLQVVLFRKKPQTLDERLPFFLALTTIPTLIALTFLEYGYRTWETGIFSQLFIFSFLGFFIFFAERWGRKTKLSYDWNWKDALILGLFIGLGFIPGGDPVTGVIAGSLFLNYRREAALKYTFYCLVPILILQTHCAWNDVSFSTGTMDVSWLSLGSSFVVAFFTGLLAIGGIFKHIQTKNFNQYFFYRWILLAGVVVFHLATR